MKLNYFKTSALIITSLILMSCGGQGETSAENMEDLWYGGDDYTAADLDDYTEEDANMQDNGNREFSPIPQNQRKLIKTAFLTYEVEDLNLTTQKVHNSLDKYNGYLSSENEFSTYDKINVTMSLRVPTEDFESFMDEVTNGIGTFDNKDISTVDVTEEFIDVKARIKTKKEVEVQYVKLLDKANSIGEIMEIERHLGEIRQEIEAAEGRLKYLQNSTSYSTISLTYYTLIEEPSKYGKQFSNSFDMGWDGFVQVFIALTALWPFAILAVIIIMIVRIIRKRARLNKQAISK
jgi:hypothetical protein